MKNWNINTTLSVLGITIVLLVFVLICILAKIYDALAAIVAVTVV